MMNVSIELSCFASHVILPSAFSVVPILPLTPWTGRRTDKNGLFVSVRCASNLNQHRRVEPSRIQCTTTLLGAYVLEFSEYVSPLRINMPSSHHDLAKPLAHPLPQLVVFAVAAPPPSCFCGPRSPSIDTNQRQHLQTPPPVSGLQLVGTIHSSSCIVCFCVKKQEHIIIVSSRKTTKGKRRTNRVGLVSQQIIVW